MNPTEWQVWNFGVLLSFATLGLSIGYAYVPGIVISIVALLILYRNHVNDRNITPEPIV